MRAKIIAAVVLVLLLALPRTSFAAFTHYTTCTVNSSQVTGTQTNFPVRITGTGCGTGATQFKSTGNGGNVESVSGYDIRPYLTSCSGTALTYQLITYSATAGTFDMAVLMSSLADGSVIYLCYGDTGLTTDGSSNTTFTTTYKVYAPLPDGTTPNYNDFSQNSASPTAASTIAASGKLDGGISFNSTSAFLSYTANIPKTTGTAACWFYPTWVQTDSTAHELCFGTLSMGGLQLFRYLHFTDNSLYIGWYNNGIDGEVIVATANYTLNANAWNHIALTWNVSGSVQTKAYLNGTQIGTTNTTDGTWTATGGITLPFNSATVATDKFDELILADSLLDVPTIYRNQVDQTAFWTESGDNVIGGGGLAASSNKMLMGVGR